MCPMSIIAMVTNATLCICLYMSTLASQLKAKIYRHGVWTWDNETTVLCIIRKVAEIKGVIPPWHYLNVQQEKKGRSFER